MANPNKLIPFILNKEGGFSNRKNDAGGPTNRGITLAVFQHYFGANKTIKDLKNITNQQWDYIFINGFWNRCKADEIISQSVANIIVDWTWNSGTHAIRRVQKYLGLDDDGIIGDLTLSHINSSNALELFNAIKNLRFKFIDEICTYNPKNKEFRRGWRNRISELKFQD